MKRKVLQIEENGIREDMMPIIDDLSVYTNGMTLREQIENIRKAIRVGELFLGAYETEIKLLEKYPNGSDLLVGTYALVTDIDAFYIYDTDTMTWRATMFSSNGIFQLNGLTGTNGVLTLTGGDINATVPSSDVPEQTISQHLENITNKTNDISTLVNASAYNIPVMSGKLKKEDNKYVLEVDARKEWRGKLTFALVSYDISKTSGEVYDGNAQVWFRLNFGSGGVSSLFQITSRKYTEKLLRKHFNSNSYVYYLVYFKNETNCSFLGKEINSLEVKRYTLGTWYSTENGYYSQITVNSPNVNVLSFSKIEDGKKKSAVLDYSCNTVEDKTTITVYSDEKISGEMVVGY